jgi:hypothetical protein
MTDIDNSYTMTWEIFSKPEYNATYIVAVYDEEHREIIGYFNTQGLAQYIVDSHNEKIGIPRKRRDGVINEVNFDFLRNGHCLNCGSEFSDDGMLQFNARAVWCLECGWARGWSEIVWPPKPRLRVIKND